MYESPHSICNLKTDSKLCFSCNIMMTCCCAHPCIYTNLTSICIMFMFYLLSLIYLQQVIYLQPATLDRLFISKQQMWLRKAVN